MNSIIGRKKEMTQIFKNDGTIVPVTIIDISSAVVASIINGSYSAILIGSGKRKNPTKAEVGKYKDLGYVPMIVTEVKVEKSELESFKIGDKIEASIFQENQKVDVTGMTKGKGFQGVVKKWNFAGGPKTHGQSDRHRAPGSIGSGTTPGRVYKGKKMGGHMGAVKQTTKNLVIVFADVDNELLAIKGAVPGPKDGVVYINSTKY